LICIDMLGKPKSVKSIKQEKSKRKPVRKISSRGTLIKKAHSIMRDIVIARDGGCVCPAPESGHSKVLQAGHIVPSTKSGVRFDLWNVHAQCSSCNGRHKHFEYYYVDWFVNKFGKEQKLRIGRDADRDVLKTYEIEKLIEQLSLIRERQKREPEWLPYFTQAEILSGTWNSPASSGPIRPS